MQAPMLRVDAAKQVRQRVFSITMNGKMRT